MSAEILQPYISSVNLPSHNTRVYKDECVYCFDDPSHENGLFICLNTFLGLCSRHLPIHYSKTHSPVYLHIKRSYQEKQQQQEEEKSADKEERPTVLGIGVPGGFSADADDGMEAVDTFSLYVQPQDQQIPLTDDNITNMPDVIQQCVSHVKESRSASRVTDVEQWEIEYKESRYAKDLHQEGNGVVIPREGWQCRACDLRQNLWLCLTCGAISCGRKNFDGSGGNHHGVEHYEATNHPLAVKLGTITPDGKGDVFSYPEFDMVLDPYLKEHLAHFGINVADMRKTDLSMAELELDANINYEFSAIEERGHNLEPIRGPGLTGIQNLGNTCYMASVMQVLFSVPSFVRRYARTADTLFRTIPDIPTDSLIMQLAKFGDGLQSGRYALPTQRAKQVEEKEDSNKGRRLEQQGIRPRMFKHLVGRGHPEFATGRQQDAMEFLQYILEQTSRAERTLGSGEDPTSALRFEVEERMECSESHQVRYTRRPETVLSLPIPLDRATHSVPVESDKQEGQKDTVPCVPLSACLDAFSETETVPGFYSSAIKKRTEGLRRARFGTFPPVLAFQARRFVFEGWKPKKLDVRLDMPDRIDLEYLRGHGKQPEEEELPEDDQEGEKGNEEQKADEGIVSALMDMGFPRVRCEKAAINTGNNNAEVAAQWLFEHMDDPDIDTPLNTDTSKETNINADSLAMLTSMGFPEESAKKALKETDGNMERAVEWLFSRSDQPMDGGAEGTGSDGGSVDDGRGVYELFGIVSHIGANTQCGHYVAHIYKEGRWVMFNDNDVGISQALPKDLGYLYFYRRVDE